MPFHSYSRIESSSTGNAENPLNMEFGSSRGLALQRPFYTISLIFQLLFNWTKIMKTVLGATQLGVQT